MRTKEIHWWRQRFTVCFGIPVAVPDPKVFKPKLPELTDYRVITDERFWKLFPQNFKQPAKSHIDAEKLVGCIRRAGMELSLHVNKVIDRVLNGAEIGCIGVFRAASQKTQRTRILTAGRCQTQSLRGLAFAMCMAR
jgi:hypothetical protein